MVIKRLDLEENINQTIFEMGSGFGPSVLGLHLYGPSGVLIEQTERRVEIPIWDESVEILKERDKVITNAYHNSIIPKFTSLVEGMTRGQASFPSKNKLSGFKLRKFEYIRKILKNSYSGQFNLDKITGGELFSVDLMNVENTCVKFYLDKGNQFLFKLRFKQTKQSKFKYEFLFNNFDEDEKEVYANFLDRISTDVYEVWNEIYRRKLLKIYGNKLERMLLGDYVGISIIDLNFERGLNRISELSKKGRKFEVPGFRLVKNRFDNHMSRLDELRPGGLHYTFVDKGLSNFPIEVQYLDYESAIRDMFGKHKHIIYEIKGKKNLKI